MKYLLILLLTMFPLTSFTLAKTNEHLFVISGVIVNSDTNIKMKNFINIISKKTGYKLKPFYVNSYDRLSKTLRDNPYALAWTCGLPYVQDSIKDNQQLVAVPLYKGKPTYSSLIISRKDNKKQNLIDFRNNIFAYSDIRSNSGYLAPSVLLKKHGLNIKNFFRVKIPTGTHEAAIEAVSNGLADVAAIDEYVWDEYVRTRSHITKKLHIIEKTGPFPFTPIVVGSGVTNDVLNKIKKSLIELTPTELESFKNDFHMDGFILKDPSFYDPIKKMLHYINEE